MLASRGLRETGQGIERVDDAGMRTRLRAAARRIGARALVATVVLTAIALALPVSRVRD